MKITEMLQREDFYQVNEDTLSEYYAGQGTKSRLYIYPRLNAIVTKQPSKKVKDYLLTEYDIRGNIFKKVAAQCYVQMCLSTGGRMADQSIELPNNATADTLIYPCNRKYRIFNFEKQTVDVQIKSGFPTDQLKHEIEFRAKKEELPEFVPALISYTDLGYKEQIIDGRALARITDNFKDYKEEAYSQLLKYSEKFHTDICGEEYAVRVAEELEKFQTKSIPCKKLIKKLTSIISRIPQIMITFSHGDLQPGNIWIESGTQKIYIIDWESWGIRSVFYDKAVLFDCLRPGDINDYLKADLPCDEKAVVLLEDLVFQLEEYKSLPGKFGKEELEAYIRKVMKWSNNLE